MPDTATETADRSPKPTETRRQRRGAISIRLQRFKGHTLPPRRGAATTTYSRKDGDSSHAAHKRKKGMQTMPNPNTQEHCLLPPPNKSSIFLTAEILG